MTSRIVSQVGNYNSIRRFKIAFAIWLAAVVAL
jgi:hypothetical protein